MLWKAGSLAPMARSLSPFKRDASTIFLQRGRRLDRSHDFGGRGAGSHCFEIGLAFDEFPITLALFEGIPCLFAADVVGSRVFFLGESAFRRC